MSLNQRYFTIPRLAQRLGITPSSIRDWIQNGYVEAPPELPVTRERAYPAEAARRIEAWYADRAANGGTRGPGAKERRERARTLFAQREKEPVFTFADEAEND